MTELDQARLAAIAGATVGRGGYFTIAGADTTDDNTVRIEWWHGDLVCPSWTQQPHRTVPEALQEAATRLGVETVMPGSREEVEGGRG